MLLRLVRARTGALLSAVLLLLTIPPVDAHVLSWLGWAPLLETLDAAEDRREAIRRGALFGALYYGLLFRWTLRLPFQAFAAIVIGAILFAVCFAVGVQASRRAPLWAKAVLIPALWIAPAAIADNSLILLLGMHSPLPSAFLQLARPLGEIGLAFFVMLVNVLAWNAIRNRDKISAASAVALLAGAWAWGGAQARAFAAPADGRSFRAACAQHDLPFAWDWRAAHQDEIFETYRSMALEAAGRGANLVLFPQYQIPEDIARHPERWAAVAREAKAYLALGTYSPVEEAQYGKEAWVVTLMFSPDGRLIGSHKALHPSPLGRPMVVAGEAADPIVVPPLGNLAVLSCYDDVTPRPSRLFRASRPNLTAAIANDGLFKGTIQPELHLFRSRLRAIENRQYVIRCTPNGISAAIDPAGRVLQTLPAGRGLLVEDFPSVDHAAEVKDLGR